MTDKQYTKPEDYLAALKAEFTATLGDFSKNVLESDNCNVQSSEYIWACERLNVAAQAIIKFRDEEAKRGIFINGLNRLNRPIK